MWIYMFLFAYFVLWSLTLTFLLRIFMSVIISPFQKFLWSHDIENILLICYAYFTTKPVSFHFPSLISMCHLRRSSEINFLNNATCLSNVLLLPNTKSTIFFDYLHIFLFIDSIFSLLGLVVQLFMLKMNLVGFIIIFILLVSCVAYFILSGVFTTVVDDMFFNYPNM